MSFNDIFKVPFINLEASKLTTETKIQIDQASYQFIFPFTIRTGFVNISENGYQPNNSIPTNYTQFAKIFNGNEGIIALWDNSIEIKLTETKPQNHFIKTVKKGDFYKGRIDNSKSGADFGKNPGTEFFGDYVSFTSNRIITIDLTYQFTKNDLFKFYMVPFDSGRDNADDNDLYFVSDCIPYYDNNGVFIYNKITFTNLKDQIASTGKTIQQFCQFGAPGESIVIPKLIYNEVGQAIDFEINKNYLIDYGVNTIGIEILGTNAFSFPIIMGRPIEKLNEFNSKIYAPRDLFMYDIKYPIVDNLSQNSNPTNIFYLTNAIASIDTYYSDWLERRKAEWNQQIKKKFEGWIQTNQDATKKTNSNGYSVRDNRWNFLNNDVININYDCRASQYFSQPKDPQNSNKGNIGYIDINLSKHNRGRIFDIMNLSRMLFNWIRTMPISTREIVPWSTTNLPIIKGFLNNLSMGIPNGWRGIQNFSDIAFPQFRGLPTFIGASIYDWYTQSFWGDRAGAGKGLVPMDAFRQDTEDEVGGIISSSSITTNFLFSLTDKILVDEWSKSQNKIITSKVYISSVMLGQTKNIITGNENDKDIIYIANPNYTVALPPTTNTDKTDIIGSTGYILEIVGFTGIGKNAVRISAYGNDPDKVNNPYNSMIWQTSIKSFAMASGAIWNIANLFKVGYLDSFISDNEVSEFPGSIAQPNPSIGSNSFTIDISNKTQEIYEKTLIHESGSGTYRERFFPDNQQILLYNFKDRGLKTRDEIYERYSKIICNGTGMFVKLGAGSKKDSEEEYHMSYIDSSKLNLEWVLNKSSSNPYDSGIFFIEQNPLEINSYNNIIINRDSGVALFIDEALNLYARTQTSNIDVQMVSGAYSSSKIEILHSFIGSKIDILAK